MEIQMKTLICKLPSLQTKQVPHREVIVGDLVIVHYPQLLPPFTLLCNA